MATSTYYGNQTTAQQPQQPQSPYSPYAGGAIGGQGQNVQGGYGALQTWNQLNQQYPNGTAPPGGQGGSQPVADQALWGGGSSGGSQSMYYPGTSTNYMNQYPDALSGYNFTGSFGNLFGGYNSYPQQTQQTSQYGQQPQIQSGVNPNASGEQYLTRNRTFRYPDGSVRTVDPSGRVSTQTVQQYGGIDPQQLGSMTLQQLQAEQGKLNPNDPNAQNQWWQIQNAIVQQANQRNQANQQTGGGGGGFQWPDFGDLFGGGGGGFDFGDLFGGGGGSGGSGGTGGGFGGLTGVMNQTIPLDPIFSDDDINRMTNQAIGQNETEYATNMDEARSQFGSSGFSTSSPALRGMDARYDLNRVLANTAARRDIPIQAQQANASHQLQALGELAKQRGLDINSFAALINAQTGVLNPLFGLLGSLL